MALADPSRSYGFIIRDTLYAKTVTLPFFAGFKSRRSKQMPLVHDGLPFLGVYFVGERHAPDGDLDAGEVRFIVDMTIGFTVVVLNNDLIESEAKLDQAYWAICNGLWADQYIMNLFDPRAPGGLPTLPDNVHIRGINGGARKHIFGNSGPTNETPIAEVQYEPVIRYSMSFPPVIKDDLLRWHQETVPLKHPNIIPPADEVQRIISEYEFTPAP